MKQIKTIKNRLDNNESFDKEVNKALAEGWKLVKREVITPNVSDRYTMLYAELEKVTILPDERGCDNCLHEPERPDVDPCFSCEQCSNWEEPRA